MSKLSGLLLVLALAGAGCKGRIAGRDAGLDAFGPDGEDAGADLGQDAGVDAADDGAAATDAGGDDGGKATDAQDAGDGGDSGQAGQTLAERYPNDQGLGSDPAVVWFEDFEEGSLSAIAARYEQARDNGRWTLVTDTPGGSGHALAMRAGQGREAVDLFKQLPDADEWYVRWHAKYEPGITWHHSGMWFGGYNPSSAWPNPQAGYRPAGDDRFSISVEPVYGSPVLRFDFYNYWMRMHSWMETPVDDGTAYYGNSLVHHNDFSVDETSWVCLEVHVRLNPQAQSGAGAILEVWKNDELVVRFDDSGPLGYWIRDKFCTAAGDGAECTDYPAAFDQVMDLQMRNTLALKLNAFWPQNYITEGPAGTLTFDQMVVATTRVGCLVTN